MDYIELSYDTAPTARHTLPQWSELGIATASTGRTSLALTELQLHAHQAIDTTSRRAHNHCASIARFADSVCCEDAQLATDLKRINQW